jgi:hypothetical protein
MNNYRNINFRQALIYVFYLLKFTFVSISSSTRLDLSCLFFIYPLAIVKTQHLKLLFCLLR